MNCKLCQNKITNFTYQDDDGLITATCNCGCVVSWISAKRKNRPAITKALINSMAKNPIMAIFVKGKLVKPTKKDISDYKKHITSEAKRLNLI